MIFNKQHTNITIIPKDLIPIDCLHEKTFIQTPGFSSIQLEQKQPKIRTWIEYINNLQTWDKELLSDIKIMSQHALQNMLQNNERIYLCSDGGAKEDIGSFGAVVASNQEIMIQVSGQAYGKTPRSFRAEGYGMLAILRFLFHFIQYHNIKTKSKLKIYSDNEGLIIRVNQIKDKTEIRPRRGMLSESDVELQIRDTLQILQSDATLHHVLGHQDNNKDNNELSWPAQLNIQCDTLATDKIKTLKAHYTVSTLPASKIMLQIGDQTITHHIAAQIRRLGTREIRKTYLTAQHRWENDFENIDWESITSSYKNLTLEKQIFIIKWNNKLLSLNHRQHRWNLYSTPKCPCCGHLETDAHLILCQQIDRKKHTAALQQIITDSMKKHNIDPDLRKIAIYFTNTKNNKKPKLSEKYRQILHTQVQLGYQSLHYGFFSKQWIETQTLYRKQMKLDNLKNQALTGIKAMLEIFWTFTQEMWELRNSQLHEATEEPLNFKKAQLMKEIETLYSRKELMLYNDRDIFHLPLQDRENHTMMQLKQYFINTKLIQTKSIADAKEFGKKHRKINHYFQRIPHKKKATRKHMKKKHMKRRYTTNSTAYGRKRRKIYENFQNRIDRIKQKSDYTQQKIKTTTTWDPMD